MRNVLALALSATLLAILPGTAFAGDADSQDIFAKLKTLAGTWTGSTAPEGLPEDHEGDHPDTVTHVFRVSANDSVVMETMNPGTDHEMINMYHLDGDELMLTHYCAAGNQPRMKLDRAASDTETLVFEFAGGTNLDPAVDMHIHEATIAFAADGGMKSSWTPYMNGEPAGQMNILLSRGE